ncbi:MAG: winged helix-turn-helix domain-containing protein [Verrucomicrobiota bacterium]
MDETPITGTWTFLTNHFHILVVLSREPTLRIRDMAEEVGITQRAVQRILAELVEDEVLFVTKDGRRNCYEINRDARLRHPLERSHSVGELLKILG